ncbi:MAG: sterol desaturase family protein [Myxococcota bacterium]
MPDLPDIILAAVPIYLVAMLLEIGVGAVWGTARYETRDTLTSLAMALGFLGMGTLFGFVGIGVLRTVQVRWGLVDWGWSPWAFVLCFVLDDLRKYWLHRIQHERRWFWAAHVTHHSSQHYNFATALRNPPTVVLTQAFVFRIPLALLGFPVEMIAFQAGINSVYQFFTHTDTVRDWPWPLGLVLVTPSHHRVHHATNARYLDANYAAVFIVWDRLFGTFVPESAEEPCRYGLVKNLGTFDPLRVTFHEWVAMGKDVLQPGLTASERLWYVLGPPGYSHDGSRETSAQLKARHAAVEALGAQSS